MALLGFSRHQGSFSGEDLIIYDLPKRCPKSVLIARSGIAGKSRLSGPPAQDAPSGFKLESELEFRQKTRKLTH
jgi:hypothetical protein